MSTKLGKVQYTQAQKPEWTDSSIAQTITSVSFDESLQTAEYKPTSLAYWFSGLTHVSTFNGWTYLDTSQVTSMEAMFKDCSQALQTLGLSSLDTTSLTDMNEMFSGCANLTSLDLSSFSVNTDDALSPVSQENAFTGCSNLSAFTVSSNYNFDENCSSTGFDFAATAEWVAVRAGISQSMADKVSLTEWNSYINSLAPAAVIYFIRGDFQVGAYMQLIGSTLYVNYGTYKGQDTDKWPIADQYSADNLPAWQSEQGSITQVVVLSPVRINEYKPQSLAYWFSGLTNLTSILNLQNLDASEVTSIDSIFSGDTALAALDLSHLNLPEPSTYGYVAKVGVSPKITPSF